MQFSLATAFLIVLAATASFAQAPQRNPNNCFQLTNSATCPDLRNFFVLRSSAFTNVATFDAFMKSNTLANASYVPAFKSDFGCAGWDGRGERYQQSVSCFLFVQNGQCPQNPTPLPQRASLCKAQCLQSVASYNAIFANTTACPLTSATTPRTPKNIQELSNRNTLANNLTTFCNTLNDAAGTCSQGLTAETAMCGFTIFDDAENFCRTDVGRRDPCCILVLSKAADSQAVALNASVVDPISSLPYVASGIALAVMSVFSLLFIGYIKMRRWNSASTTAIQPPESDVPLGRSGTIMKGRPDSDAPFKTNRRSMMQSFRQSIMGLKSRRVDPNAATLPMSSSKNVHKNIQSLYSNAATEYAPMRSRSPAPPMPAYMPAQRQNQQPPEMQYEYDATPLATAAESMGSSSFAMRVYEAYNSQLSDELTLVPGDIIIVDEEFDDGWAVGRNEATGEIGAFPIACLESLDAPYAPGYQEARSVATRSMISKRGVSLYASGRGF